jgi:hypothetical protein
LASPQIAPYIELRAVQFKVQLQAKADDNDDCFDMRLRRIFSELVCVMSLAARKVPLTEITLPKNCHLIETLRDRFKAPHTGFVGDAWITEEDGSHQLFIAVNEFAFSLQEHLIIDALFWVEWIARYPENIGTRSFAPVLAKHSRDPIWLVWELILKQTTALKKSACEKIVKGFMFLYGFRYTGPTSFKRRRFLLYSACFFLTQTDNTEPILTIEQKRAVSEMMEHIDVIYDQVACKQGFEEK